MDKTGVKYFLASNSCEGFISRFDRSYSPENNWKAYIIKGGPGTGKSSFMKYMTLKADEKGIERILCPCSSDPDSLDAVIFPTLKTVIMDGTSPHIVDPKYPGVCETILNFGEFWNVEKFNGKTSKIIETTNKNKALHNYASGYINVIGTLLEDSIKIAKTGVDKEKAEKTAERICKKFIPNHIGKPYEWERFLTGITPKGVVFYGNSVMETCENRVIIRDNYGCVADIIMQKVRQYALNRGYEIVTVRNPFLPSLFIDHIIIPELSFCVAREYEYQHFYCDSRRIHSARFENINILQKNSKRLKFNQKAIKSLLIATCEVLAEAKSVHDQMEKYYIEAMDFEKLTEFANQFADKLF